jgi:hypothetical protein
LRKNGYVEGNDIPNVKRNHKPIRMTLYTIDGWINGLSRDQIARDNQEDIRAKGDCYFNDIVELQQVRPAPLNIE